VKYTGTLNKGFYGNGVLKIELLEDVDVLFGKPKNDIKIKARVSKSQETLDRNIQNDAKIFIKSIKTLRPTIKINRIEPDIKPPISLLSKKIDASIPTNTDASTEIKDLFDGINVMDYPKPIKLIQFIIDSLTYKNKDAIILDFFAGSGTTAQAVMELNKEDNGKRKFILVQLPEKTDEESEAYKAGYKTISAISKERIRRAIKKISNYDDMIQNSKDIDLGFKSYRLKESNFKIWRSDIVSNEDDLKENIDMFEDSLKQNTKNENILTELLLKSGYDLNIKIELTKIDSSNMYIVNDKELIVCLNKISKQIIDKIIEMKPRRCFILDSLFEGKDSLKNKYIFTIRRCKNISFGNINET
jgi:hypothetical protein